MKMREYVDGLRGVGYWDRMMDAIDGHQLIGWDMPPIDVDGVTVHIFPGEDREVTLEEVQAELRKAMSTLSDYVELDDDMPEVV